MFRRGRRLFTSASLGLVLVALLHTLGQFAPRPVDPREAAVEDAMRSYRLDLGRGPGPSIMDIFQSLSLTMSIVLAVLGLLNLVVAASRDASPALVRRCGLVSALGIGGLVVLYAVYRIPPPLVTLAAVEVLYLLAVLLPARSQPAPGL